MLCYLLVGFVRSLWNSDYFQEFHNWNLKHTHKKVKSGNCFLFYYYSYRIEEMKTHKSVFPLCCYSNVRNGQWWSVRSKDGALWGHLAHQISLEKQLHIKALLSNNTLSILPNSSCLILRFSIIASTTRSLLEAASSTFVENDKLFTVFDTNSSDLVASS